MLINLTRVLRTPKFVSTIPYLSHAPQTPYLDPVYTGCFGTYLCLLAACAEEFKDDRCFLNIQQYNNPEDDTCDTGAGCVFQGLFAPQMTCYGVTASLQPKQALWGQQFNGSSPFQVIAPPSPVPAFCGASPGGMMFWLQVANDESFAAADEVVQQSLTPTQIKEKNLRIAYYLNTAPSSLPSDTSPCNVIILPFIYPRPIWTGTTLTYDQTQWGFGWPIPPYNTSYSAGTFSMAGPMSQTSPGGISTLLQNWKAADTRRKVLVSIGGAIANGTDYSWWAQGDNYLAVAQGIKNFFVKFEADNGWALDGLDIDYEDTANLSMTFPPPRRSLGSALAVIGTQSSAAAAAAPASAPQLTPSFSQTEVILVSVFGALILILIVLVVLRAKGIMQFKTDVMMTK